jgi:hypothetical protein
MDEGSKIYPPRYSLPMHTATLPCHLGRDDVTPLCEMAQYRLLASRIGSVLISTETASDVSSTTRNL